MLLIEARTVNARPTMTMPKLKVCCAARPVFSPAESSDQGTWPSSLKGVTARRRDSEAELDCW